MKTTLSIIFSLIISINVFSQGHFVLAYDGVGHSHMNINVLSSTIGVQNLVAGDEIAVFDGNICCGKIILTEPVIFGNPQTYITIAASKADIGLSNGYTAGNQISYKFWKSSTNQEISVIAANYLDPNTQQSTTAPTFEAFASAFVKLSYVTPVNQIPIANAGPNQSINEGVLVTLDGTASSDSDNNTLTYLWTAPSGITLNSNTSSKPTFTAPEVQTNTNYTFSLVVNDGIVNSTVDQVVITVQQVNNAPIANAGTDQSVNEGVLVTLNGTTSTDPDNDFLTYSWTAPSGITLSSNTASKPTFTAPEVQTDVNFTFSLTVNDGTVSSSADQVVISVKQVNKAPIANAGPDQSLDEGILVTLDGTGSTDMDSNVLTYFWSAPSGIVLNSTTASKPTFTAPEVQTNTNYTFSLVVNDGKVNSTVDQVIITVKQVNKAPLANAGPDLIITGGKQISLDGSSSSDADNDILTYSWTSTSGLVINLANTAKPTIQAPTVLVNTDFTITLTVNDGKTNSLPDPVVITVVPNRTPVANAGPDLFVKKNSLFTFDGSNSSDPDGDVLTYQWTAPSGITLTSATSAKPSLMTPDVNVITNLTFTLVVNDGIKDSPPDQVVLTIKSDNSTPVANAGNDQSVDEGSLATLNGTGSSDPDGDILSYLWIAPSGITLSSNTASNPTFTAPEVINDSEYIFSLVVNDGTVNSASDQIIVTVRQVNKVPVANAGNDQSVNEGTLVHLDGIGSYDPDNDALSYFWVAPSGITLSSNNSPDPTFTAPEVMMNTDYVFSLIAGDAHDNSVADQVTITVKQVNKAPVANAGPDSIYNEGEMIALNGTVSSDSDNNGLSYFWTAPPGITLSSLQDSKPTFIAPEVMLDTTFTISLIVNDGISNSVEDQVLINVRQVNKAPVYISPKMFYTNVDEPFEFQLEGFDIDNDPITFSINDLPSSLTISKNSSTTATLSGTFADQNTENYFFKVILSSGSLGTEETITINITKNDRSPYVKDSIQDISVDRRAPEQTIDLNTIFADDDPGDILDFSISSNTNQQVVNALINGNILILSFSPENAGTSEIAIGATSKGKVATSKFYVEVKNPTGIDVQKIDTNFQVFPNPTMGLIQINFEHTPKTDTWVSIFDPSGRIILKKQVTGKFVNLTLESYTPGIYFVKVDQAFSKTSKVILK